MSGPSLMGNLSNYDQMFFNYTHFVRCDKDHYSLLIIHTDTNKIQCLIKHDYHPQLPGRVISNLGVGQRQ